MMKTLAALLLALAIILPSGASRAQHNAGTMGKILMIASNKSTSPTTGWPIGVWYAELTHPYWAFVEAGYSVDISQSGRWRIIFRWLQRSGR
jgi:ABC-type sugar transport system substrate-binding protein